MTHPTWLEIAINGPWSRTRQPRMPVTADEIVNAALACAGEGAAIIHFHAYDPVSGRQRDDYDIYAPIIERIRSRADVICYGTLPFAGSIDSPMGCSADNLQLLQLARRRIESAGGRLADARQVRAATRLQGSAGAA